MENLQRRTTGTKRMDETLFESVCLAKSVHTQKSHIFLILLSEAVAVSDSNPLQFLKPPSGQTVIVLVASEIMKYLLL